MRIASSSSVFSLKTYVAAILALGVAFWQDLQFPYWAMMCVYLLAQPLSGGLRPKGVHMIVGSLIGGTLGIIVSGVFATSLSAELIALTLLMMAGCSTESFALV